MLFKVIVAGTRGFDDYALLETELDRLLYYTAFDYRIEIVSGTANGPDKLGELYARERGHLLKKFPADWKTHGPAAGPIRNAEMAQYADALVAFWDGKSKGTASMIRSAMAENLDIRIIEYAI